MTDTLIISSISKIYFSIVSFFIFIFLTLSVTYLFLSSGIQFKNIDFDSLRINKLYIKWDEKLNIHIKELHIYKNNKPSSKNYSIDQLITYFNKTIYLPLFLDSFHIDSLKINDINGSIAYKEGGNKKGADKNKSLSAPE